MLICRAKLVRGLNVLVTIEAALPILSARDISGFDG